MRRLLVCLALVALPAGSARAQSLVPGPAILSGNSLTQEVRNLGDATLPAGPATVTGADGARDYPAIAAGAAGSNAAPFSLELPAGAPCGDPIDLRLTLGGFDLPLRLAAGVGGTRVYGNRAAVAVPDVGSATSAVTVGGVGTLWDVNVRLDRVAHQRARDLTLELVAPDGTAVRLAAPARDDGQDFDRTLFDDQALTAVEAARAPFNAQLRPEEPLAALNGRAAQGEWKLRVTDRTRGDAGIVDGWSLELLADDCDAATPDPEPGGTGSPHARAPLPTLALAAAPTSARRFAARGVRADVGCPVDCRFRVELRLDQRTAIRLGLPRRHVRTGWRTLPAGETTTLALRPRGAGRFRRAGRGARLTVRLIASDGRSVERAFRLRRP